MSAVLTNAKSILNPRRTWAPFWIALGAAALLILADALTRAPSQPLTREHGGVELASAFLYLAAALGWTVGRSGEDRRRSWQIPAVLLMMAGREFDLDKSLTSVGLLKSKLYLTAEAPVWERLLGAAVLVVLAIVLLRLLRLNGRPLLRDLRRGGLDALAVAAGIGLAILAKTVDGLARKLEPFGIDIGAAAGASFGAAEEIAELFVPLLFILAILHNLRRREAARVPER